MNKVSSKHLAILFFLGITLSAFSFAGGGKNYKVTITNITKGQSFTPLILATHKPGLSLFELGQAASQDIADIAEGGDIGPLAASLSSSWLVNDIANSDGLLGAGQSVELMLSARGHFARLSLAAMLVPTNDTFVALNGVYLPKHGSRTVFAKAYDAGSETNDELCANVPGPVCGGEPFSPMDSGEGFVHIAAGIHGMGDIDSSLYDWRGPVARIVIERM